MGREDAYGTEGKSDRLPLAAHQRRRVVEGVMTRPTGKRGTFTFRTTPQLREQLQAAAAETERPVSEEVEARLSLSFRTGPTLEDVRLMIREEIRAALREDQKAGSHAGEWIDPNGDNLHEIPPAVAARFQAEFEAHARTLGDMRRSWQAPSVADGSHQPAAPRDYSEAVANARLNERDVPAGEYAFNRIA